MRLRILLLMFGFTAAMGAPPIGIVRGHLVSRSGDARAGLLVLRDSAGRLMECSFDNSTWFEHDHERIAADGLRTGDRLEMIADRMDASRACYAVTVQILDAHPRRTAAGKPRFGFANAATEMFAPRGDTTLSGLVTEIDGKHLTIRLRDGAEHSLLLRPDTRYLGNGLRCERPSLARQTLVYIRGGRNSDGDLEAYAIIWGAILQVRN